MFLSWVSEAYVTYLVSLQQYNPLMVFQLSLQLSHIFPSFFTPFNL